MKENLDVELADLKSRFCARAFSESFELEAIAVEWERGGGNSELELQIKKIAHSLAGVSGIFGFEDISTKAIELDEAVRQSLRNDGLAVSCRALIATIRISLPSLNDSSPR